MKESIDNYLSDIKGKHAALLGIGVSNTPLIELLVNGGVCVTACDKKTREQLGGMADYLEGMGVRLCLGEAYLDNLDCDIIFRTPGMRPDLPEIMGAVKHGAEMTSEMEVFFRVCPCPIIAVTGSDGKTTTTTIISEILRTAGRRVHLGGNIGAPLLPRVRDMKGNDIAVVELSSFQLMTMKCSPQIAVVTNVAPNHLDMHKSMEEYVKAKENIYLYQRAGDRLVVNADNDITAAFRPSDGVELVTFSRGKRVSLGAYFDSSAIHLCDSNGDNTVIDKGSIKLPGIHNIDNYMAAFAATMGLASPDTFRQVAMSFAGVEHRIELVREFDNVKYYNDSIASSPSRTIAGLRSFDDKVILIAGGYDKKIPFDTLGSEINKRVSTLILCGDTAEEIRRSVETDKNYTDLAIIDCDNMEQCVNEARKASKPGDVVILSPACASFDRYPNFAKRGRDFKKIVMELE